MSEKLHILIAGAGIGGLTAALALSKEGHRVTLIERAPELGEAGAGLQLSPNATSALAHIGILEQVQRKALQPDILTVRRGSDGAELMRMQLGAMAEVRWRAPTLVIHRADLQQVLLDRIALSPRIDLELGAEVRGFASTANGVQVGARRGEENIRFDGDMLIGADGLRSVVRGRLGMGQTDEPIYSGRTAWRTVVDAANVPPMALRYATNLWLGPSAHLVHYPLRDGACVNVVAIVEDAWRGGNEGDFWNENGDPRFIESRFSRWNVAARELIGAVASWRRWPLFDRNPVPRWSLDKVVLLGDAAHPVLPFLAQGACLAIEDAAVIGAAIARHPGDIAAAIREYEERRIVRAAEVRIASRRQGTIYHMSGLPAMARDMVMGRLSQRQIEARMDWVYKYRAG
ncbi:MAG: FAD-dependent oxidoreductase [Beijerinckiaceae bacterium]